MGLFSLNNQCHRKFILCNLCWYFHPISWSPAILQKRVQCLQSWWWNISVLPPSKTSQHMHRPPPYQIYVKAYHLLLSLFIYLDTMVKLVKQGVHSYHTLVQNRPTSCCTTAQVFTGSGHCKAWLKHVVCSRACRVENRLPSLFTNIGVVHQTSAGLSLSQGKNGQFSSRLRHLCLGTDF